MAVKTFTTGEVLTASDTNTYLANAGLVYITSTNIGSAQSSVVINNCFSSTYADYLVVISGMASSVASSSVRLTLGSTTTGYYFNGFYTNYASATLNGNNNNNSVGYFEVSFSETGAANNNYSFVISAPNMAQVTRVSSSWATSAYTGVMNGILNNTTAYTGFTIAVPSGGSGTITGGTVTVYGFRKA